MTEIPPSPASTADIPRPPLVRIIGGNSFHGFVRLYSDRFIASGYYANGHVIATCEGIPQSASEFMEHAPPFIPRLLRIIVLLLSRLNPVITFFSVMVGLFILAYPSFYPEGQYTPSPREDILVQIGFYGLLFAGYHYGMGPWHGAEHLAVNAYRHLGRVPSLEEMRQESVVCPTCEGRFVLVFLLTMFASKFSTEHLHINMWVPCLLILEGALQLDHYVGLDRIPVFKQVSHLWQRDISTRAPEERHLQAAQAALATLLHAHAQHPES